VIRVEIRAESLDDAWLAACGAAVRVRGREASPLVISITGLGDSSGTKAGKVGRELDRLYAARAMGSVETVANTIFPSGLWNRRRPKEELFARYLKIVPRLRRYKKNRHGLYFERLINFPGRKGESGTNQLAHIIDTYRGGNHRRTALQASLFSPEDDLNDSRQWGFPCLQQVAFAPDARDGSLSVTGFYAVQYLFERAYGNYLGLARLGEFVGSELGMRLGRVTCVSSVGKVETATEEVEKLLRRFPPKGRVDAS
jgi:hypothetical protein